MRAEETKHLKREIKVVDIRGKQSATMGKLDLVSEYMEMNGCNKAEALANMETVFGAMRALITRGVFTEGIDQVVFTIPNFGKFTIAVTPEHEKFLPYKNETIVVPAKMKCKFKAAVTWSRSLGLK